MKKLYAQYQASDLWSIKEDGFDSQLQNIRESQFTIGNGYLGARGILEEKPLGSNPGTYIAGIYDRLTSQVADLVNFPNPFFFKFTLKGEKVGARAMDVLEHSRVLNMKDGLLLRHTVYSDVRQKRYDYQSIRFLSQHHKHIGIMQIALTPLDSDAAIDLQTGLDVNVINVGVITEGHKKHFAIKELFFENHSSFRVIETLEKHHKVIFRSGFYYKIGSKKTYSQDNVLSLKIKKGRTAVFTKVFYISSFDEAQKDAKNLHGHLFLQFGFNSYLNFVVSGFYFDKILFPK